MRHGNYSKAEVNNNTAPKNILFISPREVYTTAHIEREIVRMGSTCDGYSAGEAKAMDFDFNVDNYDVLYVRFAHPHFDEVVDLAESFRDAGKRVVDEAVCGGDIGLGKLVMYDQLREAKVTIPETRGYIHAGDRLTQFPYVLKWTYGMRGEEVFLVTNEAEHQQVLAKFMAEELLWQEFVPVSYEYKVFTLGYEATPHMLRYRPQPSGFRVDFTTLEVLKSTDFPAVAQLAASAAKAGGREVCKADIVETKSGELFVLEVNRAPGIEHYEQVTGENLAESIARYILR